MVLNQVWGTDEEEDLGKRTLRARKNVPKGDEQVPKITLSCRKVVWEKVTVFPLQWMLHG